MCSLTNILKEFKTGDSNDGVVCKVPSRSLKFMAVISFGSVGQMYRRVFLALSFQAAHQS